MEKNDLWIVEHFSELVTKYAGKYVAVVNETLVAVGESRREVETKARALEPHKSPLCREYPGKRIWCVSCRIPLYPAQRLSDANDPHHAPGSQSLGLC